MFAVDAYIKCEIGLKYPNRSFWETDDPRGYALAKRARRHFDGGERAICPERELWRAILSSWIDQARRSRTKPGAAKLKEGCFTLWTSQICEFADIDYDAFKERISEILDKTLHPTGRVSTSKPVILRPASVPVRPEISVAFDWYREKGIEGKLWDKKNAGLEMLLFYKGGGAHLSAPTLKIMIQNLNLFREKIWKDLRNK